MKSAILSVDRQVGGRIRQLRERKGISTETLASLLCVTSHDVTAYEAGVHRPAPAIIVKIAGIFEVNIVTFFDDTLLNSKLAALAQGQMK